MKISLSSDDILPFHGYRRLRFDRDGFERGSAEQYSSIEHFVQSEKFRGVNEQLRQHIMLLPTAREARKAALKAPDMVRRDWEQIRNDVMAAGIWFKFMEHQRYAQALLASPDLAANSYRFKDHYWSEARDGISSGFYRRLLLQFRERLQAGIMRVVVTGSPEFTNYQLLDAKLRSLFRQRKADELIIKCDRGTDGCAERWAIANHVPVKHLPLRGSQSKAERTKQSNEALSLATHAIVFWQGRSVRTAEFVTAAKSKGIQLRVFKIDPNGELISQPTARRTAQPRTQPS